MVDRAKMGQTEELIEDEVSLDLPCKEDQKYHEAIYANKKDVVLPVRKHLCNKKGDEPF